MFNLLKDKFWTGDKRFNPPVYNKWYLRWKSLVMARCTEMTYYTLTSRANMKDEWRRHPNPKRASTIYRINDDTATVFRPGSVRDYDRILNR